MNGKINFCTNCNSPQDNAFGLMACECEINQMQPSFIQIDISEDSAWYYAKLDAAQGLREEGKLTADQWEQVWEDVQDRSMADTMINFFWNASIDELSFNSIVECQFENLLHDFS